MLDPMKSTQIPSYSHDIPDPGQSEAQYSTAPWIVPIRGFPEMGVPQLFDGL